MSNNFLIRRLGSHQTEKIKCSVIFASNKNLAELKDLLLADFFDRIAQLVISFPALREMPEERLQDWQQVWQQLNFSGLAPEETALLDCLHKQPLYGNFRDLQKIAIYYKSFMDFNDELKQLIGINSAFEYAKKEFEKYHTSIDKIDTNPCFIVGKTAKEMEQCFHNELIAWAAAYYGGTNKKIAEKLGVTERTLNHWKINS